MGWWLWYARWQVGEPSDEGSGAYEVARRVEEAYGRRTLRWAVARDADDRHMRMVLSFARFPAAVAATVPFDVKLGVLRMEEDELEQVCVCRR